MCRAPLGTRKLISRFYHDCILHRRNLQTEEVTECGSYHSTNKGQRSGGSETLHRQRCPRPQGREMTGGLFPRQLPGPRLGMQGSCMAGTVSDFPGASGHLLPSPPQPPGLSWWSQKLQDLLGGFPGVGPAPPGLLADRHCLDFLLLSWGVPKPPLRASFLRVLPSLPSRCVAHA